MVRRSRAVKVVLSFERGRNATNDVIASPRPHSSTGIRRQWAFGLFSCVHLDHCSYFADSYQVILRCMPPQEAGALVTTQRSGVVTRASVPETTLYSARILKLRKGFLLLYCPHISNLSARHSGNVVRGSRPCFGKMGTASQGMTDASAARLSAQLPLFSLGPCVHLSPGTPPI